MIRGTLIVRLLAAAIVSFAACKVVNVYSESSNLRYKFDHPGGSHMTPFNDFVLKNGGYAYVVPSALLLVGIVVVWHWPKIPVLIELVVSTLWVLAFVWFALTLLSWQAQNIPIFSGTQLHY
jgi:hypothetical protein